MWAEVNFIKFNKAKPKVLHMGHSNPRRTNGLGRDMIESSPTEKDLGLTGDEKFYMSQQCVLTAQEANQILTSCQ